MAIASDAVLILRRTPYGESSLVVHALTRRHGRVHVLAKGAYRPTSGFFGVLDLFDTLDLEWSASPRSELALLRRGSLTRRRRGLTASLEAYDAGLAVLELSDLASRPGQPEEGLFGLTEAALDQLDGGECAPQLTRVVFELRFLQNLGLAPALETCAVCGGPAAAVHAGRAAFSAGAGGRLCLRHAEEARASGRRVGTLPDNVLQTAAQLARAPFAEACSATLSDELQDRVRDFVERFLGFHLENRPASHRTFLSAPNRNAPRAGSPAH